MSHSAVLSGKASGNKGASKIKSPKLRDLSVCLLSAHPLVLGELEKLLTRPGFRIVTKQLESSLAPELRRAQLPKAGIYVIDAHASQQAAAALISNILEANPAARLIVVGEKLTEAGSYALLRMG